MAIDIIFVVVLVYGIYLGFTRGIIKTVFTILSYFLGFMSAFKFTPSMTRLLESTFQNDNPLMYVAAFLLTLVGTMLLIRLFARGLEGILETVNINIINQAAGGVVLGAVMVLLYSLVLWFGDKSGIITERTKQESVTYQYLEDYPAFIWDASKKLRPVFEDFWDHTVEFLDRLDKSGVQRTESDPTFYDIDENDDSTSRPRR